MGNSWLRRPGPAKATSLPPVAGSKSRLPTSFFGGVAQRESARLSGEGPPVRVRPSPLRGGCGVTAASEVVILAVPVRIRSAALPLRTLSTGELSRL